MLLAVNLATVYHMVGSVNGVNIKFMLDTGASVSLISECMWNKLAEQTTLLTKWDGRQLVGVEGSLIPMVGVAALEACFSDVNVWAEFIMAKTLSMEAILGLDFLEQNHCVINAE